jgi:GAF domain-containing protein
MGENTLSERMAAAARELQDQADPQETLEAAVRLAVSDVEGADSAAVSIGHVRGQIETPASVGEMAVRGDKLQYETGEGPCLEAIWEEHTVYSPDLASDPRWPAWGARMAEETGAQSILAFHLFTQDQSVGALNLYSKTLDGFDAADREHGMALAAHIAVALASARKLETLGLALDTRTMIGQAVGIVMERYSLKSSEAFALLSRLSQNSNVKVRDLASEIVETGGAQGLHERQ